MTRFLISATVAFVIILTTASIAGATPFLQLQCKKCKLFGSIECENEVCYGCIPTSRGYDECEASGSPPSCPECPHLCAQVGECP